jgi:hypothetical protein
VFPLGAAVAALTVAAVLTAGGPAGRGASALHLGLWISAGAAWALAILLLPKLPPRRWHLAFIVVVSLAGRAPAWLRAPTHSDDVWRYLWDGHVTRAGINPYRYAPVAPELAPLRDDNWGRINHPQMPTIYPPLAQLAFAASPSLSVWKLIVALADLATLALLVAWLRTRGADARAALTWGWSPLVVVELGLNAHVDCLGVLALVAALYAWERRRPWLAGALLGASAAVKLLAAAVLPSTRSGRALAAGVVAIAIAVAPLAASQTSGNLGEYSRRWRGNDGAFALLQRGVEAVVTRTRFARRTELSPRLARLISGRDRDQVYADEVAGLAARAIAATIVAAALFIAWRRRIAPAGAAEITIGGILLFAPIVHPWYGVWMAPLVAVGARRAWLAMLALLPLAYLPLDGYLATGVWSEGVLARTLIHGSTWVLLALGLICSRA